MVPSRDLWQGIEARIAAPVIPLAARPPRAATLRARLDGNRGGRTDREHGRYHPHAHREVIRAGRRRWANARINAPDSQMPSVTGTTPALPVDVGGPGTQSVATASPAKSTVPDRSRPPVSLVKATADDRAHSDQVYGKEIDMLQNIVSQRRTQLDSSTVAIIEKNLKIIDRAIEQSRAALRQGSGQPDARPTAYTCARQEGRASTDGGDAAGQYIT